MTEHAWASARISGRTFVVTGASSGLGLAATRQLARHGAHVVMAVRDEAKGYRALALICDAQPGADVAVRRLDLADLDSVKAFAEGVHADGLPVDVLINNAGVMAPPRVLSPQGHELQFAVNHLGHFALTGLLMDLLQAGRDPRVVTVSSIRHRGGRIHFDDRTGTRGYAAMEYYDQSKFANVLFALELDRRLRAARSPVRSLVAHPGVSATHLQTACATGLLRVSASLSSRVFGQNAEFAVLPQLYAATATAAQGGQFYGPDGWRELRGYPKVVQPDPAAEDPDTAGRLWDLSEDLTGVSFATAISA